MRKAYPQKRMIPMLPSLLGLTASEGQERSSLFISFASGTIPSGVVFSNTSSQRCCSGSDGVLYSVGEDEPRFEYDPLTGKYLGLLYEEQRTNKAKYPTPYYSSSTGFWYYNRVDRTADLLPLGVLSLRRITEQLNYGIHEGYLAQNYATSYISGMTYTTSCVVQVDTATCAQMNTTNNVDINATAVFDLVNEIVSDYEAGSLSYFNPFIIKLSNNLFRIGYSFTAGGNVSGSAGGLCLTNNNPSASRAPEYTGTGLSLLFGGWQLEEGDSASSIILGGDGYATTRAADQLTFDIPSGINTLRLTLGDDTTQDISVTGGTSDYTLDPSVLNEPHIKYIEGKST